MIVGALLLLGAVLGAALYIRKLFRWDDPRLGREDRRPAPWFQLATYAGGRVTHLTPMRDGVHREDEVGDCFCHPSSGAYRTTDDQPGVLYVHHVLADRLQGVGR